jgi:hypothetical protein
MWRALPWLVVIASACSHDDGAPLDMNVDAGADDLTSPLDLASACPRTPRGDDAPRTIVIAHPYDATGANARDYEVLTLTSDGTITRTNQHFTMGRGASGQLAFTADGAFGFVAQDDGSIGVVHLVEGAAPAVVEATHKDTPSASFLWVGPGGDHLYVLDADTDNNGGGVYDLPIACDGQLGPAQQLSGADVPAAMLALPGGDLALYARKLPGATAGQSVHRVQLGPPFTRVTSTTAFTSASDDAVIASSTRTHDGKWALFGDNSEFSGVPNRIAAIEITSAGFGATQVLTPENDPVALVASPYDNLVLVVSGYDNAFRTIAYDPGNASTPFALQGAVTYMGAKPQLPNGAILIERGKLKGTVYVAENLGIRPVRFEVGGTVTDLGRFPLGSGTENVTGAIGVTP